jgi:hypothetical protein
MRRVLILTSLAMLLLSLTTASAQRPGTAPATAGGGKPPDTVLRKDRIQPWGGAQDSGVSGDPAKATADIGRMGVEFKVNAGINQYRLLKNPSQRGGGRRGGGQ